MKNKNKEKKNVLIIYQNFKILINIKKFEK